MITELPYEELPREITSYQNVPRHPLTTPGYDIINDNEPDRPGRS